MARKSLGFVELEWTCPNCGTKNSGMVKTCSGCGTPQPDDVKFEQVDRRELIKDEEKIKQVQKGPDIHCPYCSARNPGDAEVCTQCGGDLVEGLRRERGQVLGAFSKDAPPVKPVSCPSCDAENPGDANTCSACGATLREETPPPVQAPAARQKAQASQKTSGRRGCGILGLAVLGLGVFGLILFLLLGLARKEDVSGSVQSLSWVRMISVEALVEVTRSDFLDSIPVDASPYNCRMEYHHTQDEPAPGAAEVCGTPYTIDTGTGAGEVVQDCEYRVEQDYCDYEMLEWQQVDSLRLEGRDLNPQWPATNLMDNEREGDYVETYTVLFDAGGKTYEFQTSDEQLYRQCQPGSTWMLTLNAFGNVVGIEPR